MPNDEDWEAEDVVIEHRGYTCVIAARRSFTPFRFDSGLEGLIIEGALTLGSSALGSRLKMKVGVLRERTKPYLGMFGWARLVHRERLAPQTDPRPLMERLEADVRAGRFAP